MKHTQKWTRRVFVAAAASLAMLAAVTGGASASSKAAPDLNLINPGTLTVGMTLQFKPEMYLKNGKPAGYDVELVTALAKAMGVKLKIKNLGFNGLIPGLVAKKFDMVSVGLSPTPERKKAIDFTRSYVPYALILAVPVERHDPGDVPGLERPEQDDHRARGLDRRDAGADGVPEGEALAVPGRHDGAPAGRDRSRERGRDRELPARAVQQVEPRQAQGSGVQEAAERAVRLVGGPEGQQRAAHLPEQVPLQGAEQRPDGLDLQEHRGHDDPADAQVLDRRSLRTRSATTSSSSAAGPQGSPPVPWRPTPGWTVGIVDERPTFGGQIYKQFGAGFRVRDAAAAGTRLRAGAAS